MTRSWSFRLWTAVGVAAALSVAAPAQAAASWTAPPSGLRVAGATETTVDLAWAPADRATGYHVLRGLVGGALAEVGSATGATYTDKGLSAGTTYVYAVAAVRKGKVSDASATVTVTTVPPAPTGLTAEWTTWFDTGVRLLWNTTPGATGYEVTRATGDGPIDSRWAIPVAVCPGDCQVPSPSLTDVTAQLSQTYTYVLVARNASGTSAPATVTFTTPAQQG